MANKNYPNVKIISESFIRPNCELEQSKNPYYLSVIDLFQLSLNYSFRGLLYAKPASTSIVSLVDKLKHSLSVALVDFYPLAGRLETTKYDEDHASWVYVDCNKGPGVIFIHATTMQESNDKVTVSEIVNQRMPLDISAFFYGDDPSVVNHDGHTRPLVSVQVTELVDGVFIGFTINHSLGDGISFMNFINTLSKIYMQLEKGSNIDIEKPIIKPMFHDGYGPIIKLPHLDPSEFITRVNQDPRVIMRAFHFSAESVARLKAKANKENNSTDTISSFQALSAFVWLSITRARNLPTELVTVCLLTADARRRSDPPLSSNYFGNVAHGVMATSKVKDLDSNGLGWAAMVIHKEIVGLDHKAISEFWRALSEDPQVVQPVGFFGNSPPLIFTQSMKFDAYGPQFGLGKAIALRTGHSTWMDGKIVMDPGREGGGSATLQIGLFSDAMTALEADDEFKIYVS